MINPSCDFCGKELDDFGTLLFSPPQGTHVRKYHICKVCYEKILRLVDKIKSSSLSEIYEICCGGKDGKE